MLGEGEREVSVVAVLEEGEGDGGEVAPCPGHWVYPARESQQVVPEVLGREGGRGRGREGGREGGRARGREEGREGESVLLDALDTAQVRQECYTREINTVEPLYPDTNGAEGSSLIVRCPHFRG